MPDVIERDKAINAVFEAYADGRSPYVALEAIPPVDVVARDCYDRLLAENDELRKERPVVRCKDCKHYVPAEDDGEMMCVKDADWCVEDGCYYGFTESHDADWFCADGARMDGDA